MSKTPKPSPGHRDAWRDRSRQNLRGAFRRPAMEAVTRELLALTQAEFLPNWDRTSVPLILGGGNSL